MLETTLISYLIVGFLGAILGSFLLHEYDNYGKAKNGLKLRSEMSLDTHLSIGDKCKVKTIHQKSFLVLPENIKSNF